jgi:hypothetical protein
VSAAIYIFLVARSILDVVHESSIEAVILERELVVSEMGLAFEFVVT